jgi:alpha-mannosidase
LPNKYPNLKKVVVVFKTHFDLGFTALPDEVMSLYTGPMFAAMRETIHATEGEPDNLRYTWTLPAWPLAQLLHDPGLPAATREGARTLVEQGRLVWHAWPFTTHTAFCGLEDLVRGLHVARGLSDEFGRSPCAAKQTDVPGHTWIFPSLLVRAGVRFLHLGCNAGSHAPHVPRLFWWEGPDGSRLLTFYSVGGYGTSPLPPDDWPHDTWLALQHTVDNHGPHTPEDLKRIREEIEEKAPGAEILFGELHDFADALLGNPRQLDALPVVAYDLADTWVHGVGTMPREVSRVRALRQRIVALEARAVMHDLGRIEGTPDFATARRIAPHIRAAYEQLMLFGEHTWGLDVKSTIKREFDDFVAARETEPYKRLESSWVAKAAYVERAESALKEALREFPEAADPERAAPTPQGRSERGERALENRWLRLEVDPASGGITSLFDKRTKREWVDRGAGEPFGGYRYDLYSAADIAEFLRAYGRLFQDWFLHDFGKPGYPEETPHVTTYARDFTLSREGSTLHLRGGRLSPSDALIPAQRVDITIDLPEGAPYIDLTYRIKGKAATPMTESAVVAFPLDLPKAAYRLGQVGSVIDPLRDIAAGANHHLWCVDGWVDASDDRVGLAVIPLDMPLVSIGDKGIYRFSTERTSMLPQIYAHLFNTQWGTNFPQWHEGDFTFRVRLAPHAGDWRSGEVWRTALDAQRALVGPFAFPGQFPVRASAGLVLTSIRPSTDGTGLIVRYWDALGLPRRVSIEFDLPVSAVSRCDLMERVIEPLATHTAGGTTRVDLSIAPHAVETLLVGTKV